MAPSRATVKLNRAQRGTIPASDTTLFAAAIKSAQDQGWSVEENDREAGRVVALTPIEIGSGLITRERWVFTIGDHEVAVQKFLEAAEGTDPAAVLDWESYDVVCAGYHYTSERAQLASIENLARGSLARNP